jgi:hypothetical protein
VSGFHSMQEWYAVCTTVVVKTDSSIEVPTRTVREGGLCLNEPSASKHEDAHKHGKRS